MRRSSANDQLTGTAAPWDDNPGQFVAAVQKQLPCDALAVGVLQVQRPQPDEILLAHGVPEPDLLAWCGGGHQQDRLFQQALQAGQAVTDAQQPDLTSPLAKGAHAMVHMVPESIARGSWWWMVIRRGQPFNPTEQQLAGLMLRYWQVGFDQPDEPGMNRLLIGHDDRLILADVGSQAQLLRHPTLVQDLLGVLHPAVEQRYPNLPDQSTRDLAVRLGERASWVCFRKSRALPAPEAQHLYVELRPLDADELPPVGTVKDERIAQAIAFIHENFHRSPSLAEVARAVHVSPFHFHRLFTRQVGLSPKHYLQRKQLQVAKWMLRCGGVPIGDIARQTGFSSHGHFTSTFHRLVGMSPSEYRERH